MAVTIGHNTGEFFSCLYFGLWEKLFKGKQCGLFWKFFGWHSHGNGKAK